jgi:hypothetical protein
VQGVRLQRFARSLARHPIEQARAKEIDRNGGCDHREGGHGRFDRVLARAGEPAARLDDHRDREHE